jgi:small-conductance mechanosensitive channel
MDLESILYGNSLRTWLFAVGLTVVVFLAVDLVRRFIVRRLSDFAAKTATQWDDIAAAVLRRTNFLFVGSVAVVVGARVLTIDEKIHDRLEQAATLAFLLQLGLWGVEAIRQLVGGYRAKQLESDRGAATMAGALGFVGQLVLWAVVVLLILDNLGVNISALVAGLGVGGIAVALATQKILGDLLASLAIVFDKPFVIGDTVKVDALMGTVESIGLKTTRIRSLSGEQLIFSNADLLESRVHNFGRLQERRNVLLIGVTYQTPRAKLEAVPGILRGAIEAEGEALVRHDRSHFKSFGAYSIDFESVYWVKSAEFVVHMDVQQRILLRIHEAFEREGIQFAYPTQTVFVERTAS